MSRAAKRLMPKQLALVMGLIAAACLLGILNSGGYRYGASDQAFYLPAVIQHLDGSLFPRDRTLLHAQDRFMLFDNLAATVAKTMRVSVPALFFALFLTGLLLYFGACVALGRLWYRSWWSVSAFIFVMTLRHRITRTGVNTLEGYLHPRMLAFAVALWALVAFLRGRPVAAGVLVVAAAALHPTTALWFAMWIGVALAVSERRWRGPLVLATSTISAVGVWSLWFGPFGEQLQQMDDQWLAVLGVKDYLFATAWPLSAWLINLAYPLIVWTSYRRRRTRAIVHPRERAFVIGGLALAGVFVLSLPFVTARVALAVQLQVPRVFWMLDLMATLYLVGMAVEFKRKWPVASGFSRTWGWRTATQPSVRRWVPIAVVLAAVSRGVYIMQVERPERRVVQIAAPEDPWTDVMRWLRQTPPDTHVLADPDHAFRYGSSARVLGERDLYLENGKDTALAIYSRSVASRVLERAQALGDFATLTPGTARTLAAKYDLDYLISERPVDLPRVYANGRFNVYALKDSSQ